MKKHLLLLFCMLSCAFLSARTPLKMNVMTYNILCGEGKSWDERVGLITNQIQFYDCDVVGMQEVRNNQKLDICKRLSGYTHVGVGRTDGITGGEHCSVLFKTDRFNLIKSGTFWLSEDETAVGRKGWDAAYERIVTWVVLKDKASGKKFLFMNTHLDHMGLVARRESARLLLKKGRELSGGLPVIMTGDFNAVKNDEPIQILLNPDEPDHFIDSRSVAALVHGPEWTFQDLGNVPFADRVIIDYIFIRGKINVLREGVLTERMNGLYLSDHCPLLATVEIP